MSLGILEGGDQSINSDSQGESMGTGLLASPRAFFTLLLLTLFFLLLAQSASPRAESLSAITFKNQTDYSVEILEYDLAADSYSILNAVAAGQLIESQAKAGNIWFFVIDQDTTVTDYMITDEPVQTFALDNAALVAAGLITAKTDEDTENIGTKIPLPLPERTPTTTPPFSEDDDLPIISPPVTDSTEVVHSEPGLWYEAPDDGIVITAKGNLFVNVTDQGRFSLVKTTSENTAKSTAVWFAQEDPETGTYTIRNTHFLDGVLYIDENSQPGWRPRFGAGGKGKAVAQWQLKKGAYYWEFINDARPDLVLSTQNGDVILSSRHKMDSEHADMKAFEEGKAWMLFSIKSFRSLMSISDSLVQMAENFAELERKEAARLAEIERKKQDAIAAEEKRREILRAPKIMGSSRTGIAMRLGVGEIVTNNDDSKMISYRYRPAGYQPYLQQEIYTSTDQDKGQNVQLTLEPTVTALVKDEELYIRVQTPATTSVEMRHGTQPASNFPTDGNFYIKDVNMYLDFPYGRETFKFPVAENQRTDAGVSQDSSEGVNFSFEEIVGADLSVSRGRNVNFSANDFEVSGKRGPAEDEFFGAVQYDWIGCGLAATVQTTNNCTYKSPVDMYDPDTQTLRDIKVIAQSMPGLETDTIFRVDRKKQGLSDRLWMTISVQMQLHSAKIVKSTKENTKNKDWEDFKSGFTYVFRPDKWNFTKSFEEQELIKEALYKPIGFTYNMTFDYTLYIHIDDLKQYMR